MKTSGVPISAFNERTQRQILAQLHPGDPGARPPRGPAVLGALAPHGSHPLHETGETRLRQVRGPKLNKTESAFEMTLRFDHKGQEILVQAVTLLLANGVRYTPDFFVPCTFAAGDGINCAPIAYEVKGFMREDAAVKIKVAAKAYPWIRFFLVWKRTRKAGGGWGRQEILA